MRITREALLKIAHEAAAQRVRANRDIICIYLTGSLLGETPLLGGTADIDLICVHNSEPAVPREVIRQTDDVHVDIGHVPQNLFRQPRHLRLDPWVGAYLVENPLPLHDVQHWFEFTQASVAATFYEPETVIQRVRPMAEAARAAWYDLQADEAEFGPQTALRILWILEKTANSIACLSGPALTERRFMLGYPARAEAVGRPGLAPGLIDLFMPEKPDEEAFTGWLGEWGTAFAAASRLPGAPVRLAPFRRHYYERAMSVLWADAPAAAIWVLLRTWTLAVANLPGDPYRAAWQSAATALGLDADHFEERLTALDAYLDGVEETIDTWAGKYGV